jgi:putative SOS response-associated peptidase YedK
MFLGGIYKVNEDGVMKFNILTTEPNAAISDFHHRTPIIVTTDDVKTWMNSDNQNDLYEMIGPYEKELIIYQLTGTWIMDGTMDLSVWNRSMPRAIACAMGEDKRCTIQ